VVYFVILCQLNIQNATLARWPNFLTDKLDPANEEGVKASLVWQLMMISKMLARWRPLTKFLTDKHDPANEEGVKALLGS